jgi:hypothetical protein
MFLTPRLKRVWRRINKAKCPPTRAPTIRQAHYPSITFGGGRKYDLSVPGVRYLELATVLRDFDYCADEYREQHPFYETRAQPAPT